LPDVAGALVHAALGFAEQRLRETEQQALTSAAALASKLGGGAPANAASAESELTQARADLAAFHASLAQPISLPAAKDAAAHLASGLGHVDRAIDFVRPGTHLGALLSGPFGAPITPHGLGQQLGLRVPGSVQLDGTVLKYEVSSAAGAVTIGPGLRADSAHLRAVLHLDGASPALSVAVTLTGTAVAVAGDSFLTTLFGSGASASADVTLGADTDRGVSVAGATHGPIALPGKASTPLVDVRGVTLDLPTPETIEVSATVAGSMGSAVRFTVDGVGVRAHVDGDLVSTGAAVTVEAKPPRGVGILLDGGLVRGGGFLEVDGGTYKGALDVRFGPVEAKAFGILDTRVPGGFSLVVVISAEFFPPIEIALGFTLNGVGGIVGVQRALDTDALRARLHDHAIDHLLFPADPVSAAPQILQTLGAVFPPLPRGVVVGPMVKLGWGRPVSFLTASVGVIVALPDPKLVLIGSLRLAVPAPDLPLVDLKGAIYAEITAEHVLVLVLLEDSRVAGYPVSGDLGFFVGFGGEASFAVSAGGFHPRYTPPRELADMRRLSIDLSPPALLSIRASGYVAFTTNSFQLGGRLEAWGDAGPVSVHGFVQLDAIVRWAPHFAFEADLGAGFDMRFEGHTFAAIELHLHLGGPAPWTADGTATLELPILPDIDVHVGPLKWGDDRNPPPAIAHPLELVQKALAEPSAWRAELPQGADGLVTVRSDPDDPPLLVHPLGLFEGRQRAVPLEVTVVRVGPSPVPGDEVRVHLGQPTVKDEGGAAVDFGAVSPVNDHFPPGQFLDLSDDDKLRRPAFEDMLAGVRLGPPGGIRTDTGRATQSDLHYDTVFPHQTFSVQHDPFFSLLASAALVLTAGAAGRSALRADVLYASKPDPIVFAPAAEVKIRNVSDLGAPAGLADVAVTYSAAAEVVAARADAPTLQLVALGTAA
jgi:hypothetical protein